MMAKHAGGPFLSGWLPGGGLPDQEWKLPLSLAVALHVAVLVLALASPVLFDRRPVLPEIHTVNLFNAVESGAPAPVPKLKRRVAAPKSAPKVVEPQPTVKTMESEPIKKETPAPPSPPKAAPAKAPAVSERPLPAKTAKDVAQLREIKRSLADRQAREAEQLARQQLKDALATIRDLYQKENIAAPAPTTVEPPMPAAEPAPAVAATASASGSGGGEGAIVEEVLRRYLAAVHARIQQHWALPDLQSWDDSLEALMVIKLRKDGIVTDSFFEKRSENFYFDQFVEKAIREASPLPPFPPALKEERLEIGLRFRPGEIF